MSKLSRIRQLDTSTPEKNSRDAGRLVQNLDEMHNDLPRDFVERWKRRPETVTVSSVRPALKWGELTVVDATVGGDLGSTELVLRLPNARPVDAGRRVQFVKKYALQSIRLQPMDGSLINTFPNWGGMHQIGLHEIWWDGGAWWVKEPGVRVRRHGLEHQPLGLWQLGATNGLADFSGHKRTLTAETGTARYTYIHPSLQAFKFDGATSLIYNVADANLLLTGDMSFLFLFQLDVEATNDVFFSHQAFGENEAENQLYGLKFSTAPAVQWLTENGAGVNSTLDVSTTNVPLNQLCHIGVTRVSDVVRLYLNGKLWGTASSALTTPTGGSSGRLRVGSDAGAGAGGNFIAGAGTSYKLTRVGLSSGQVAAEYNRTMGPAFGFIDSREAA